ncbi:peptidase family M48 protein [Tanacetum coccineum]
MVNLSSSSNTTSDLNNQSLLIQNPLFLHPSDGPGTLVVHEKLIGAQNFCSWKRSVEIALSTKQKLGFIRGIVPRSPDDASLQEQWDTCNNLMISWLMNYVSESIAKSIMFIDTTHAIWLQLETRFALSNGSHKYKLNRETYDTMQSRKLVSEYYTSMKYIWEELDSINELPRQLGVESTALYSKGETKDKTTALVENGGHVVFTSKQFEQLLKSLPHFNQNVKNTPEIQHPFGEGTVYCFSCVNGVIEGWLIDTGVSDHMSPDNNDLDNVHVLKNKQVINLPNGHTSVISKVGNVTLENKLELKNVLIVPSFKFRLLSVSKLTKDPQCFVTFYEQFCVIQDFKTRKVFGLVSALEDCKLVNTKQVTSSSTAPMPKHDVTYSSPSMPGQETTSDDLIPEPECEPVLVPNTPV